jgi:hypothetical protein
MFILFIICSPAYLHNTGLSLLKRDFASSDLSHTFCMAQYRLEITCMCSNVMSHSG